MLKTGDLVKIHDVGIEHLQKYNGYMGEIISWIVKGGIHRYKVRIYKVDDYNTTAYFREWELGKIEGDLNI